MDGRIPDAPNTMNKKRKTTGEAERVAAVLSGLTSVQIRRSKLHIERNVISFAGECVPSVCQTAHGQQPQYCPHADLRYGACLPGREYLTRYSVFCRKCRPGENQVFHLHCAYCQEILTGSIANPGGKISDHVVTIRHVVKEAVAQNQHFENNLNISIKDFQRAREYVRQLEHWASAVRFKPNSEEKREFVEVLTALRTKLDEASFSRVYVIPLSNDIFFSRFCSPFLILPLFTNL
jgi:hypothetical protein